MSKTWKNWETRLSKMLGGQRRGADYVDKNGDGKTDIVLPGFSVETKKWAKIGFQVMLDEARHAEERKENPTDIPLAVISRLNDPDGDALVVFRLETFLRCIYPLLKDDKIFRQMGY